MDQVYLFYCLLFQKSGHRKFKGRFMDEYADLMFKFNSKLVSFELNASRRKPLLIFFDHRRLLQLHIQT